jgi:hypothetical protein
MPNIDYADLLKLSSSERLLLAQDLWDSLAPEDIPLTDRKWVNQAHIDEIGTPQGALTTTERQELAQLRKDNRRL